MKTTLPHRNLARTVILYSSVVQSHTSETVLHCQVILPYHAYTKNPASHWGLNGRAHHMTAADVTQLHSALLVIDHHYPT